MKRSKNGFLKRDVRARNGAVLCLLAATLSMLTGCGAANPKPSDPITVSLWSSELLGGYAQYIQSQLPDVDIQFVVGNNDLDYYRFLCENGALPDIITSRRFSLCDATEMKESLMDLSDTEEAGAIYETYLTSFMDSEGRINWLPVCGMVDGIVANRSLFDRYGIPLPTDYESFASACQRFEDLGIRGFVADFAYDYTCMELLQGWSIPELTSLEGQSWRLSYEDPQDELTGLDGKIWPGVFRRMERFLKDAKVRQEDLRYGHSALQEMFLTGQAAMIRTTGAFVVQYQNMGLDTVFLPYYGENGEAWLMTYPCFQVALSAELEQNRQRQEQAMRVMKVMLSEGAQNALTSGDNVISYSQRVNLPLNPELENLRPIIQQNHLFIRLASNAFFTVSKETVSKMIQGELDAQQACEAFDARLRGDKSTNAEAFITLEQGYSNAFRKKGGSEASSVMANSLREYYGSEVLIAPAYSFTGSVIQTDYTRTRAGQMIMPNSLESYSCEMTGAELKHCLRLCVEGFDGGFTPFNPGSLPAVSGITIEVTETESGYTLTGVRRNGKEIGDEDSYRVTCLNTASDMSTLVKRLGLPFEKGQAQVRRVWLEYLETGGMLIPPTDYITLKKK